MKVPSTAICGRDPPDHQLQPIIPRAAAWHLCESLEWGDVYPLLPRAGSAPRCSLAPSAMLLVIVQRAVPPPDFAKEFLCSWEHNSRGRRRGTDRSLFLASVLPRESSAGFLSQLASAHSPACCWCQVCGSKDEDCKQLLLGWVHPNTRQEAVGGGKKGIILLFPTMEL